ncbi:hypothetical protein PR048_023819 [Dryococelus australis]|uniref:DDE-1 domain-containing protein n=1 Tax=Dryococelus australis TaxID=614101 RepID=A0ABQ9GV58_9NEOP|nr:hypothetical protein PR048_023819 [Dryococelus australis]
MNPGRASKLNRFIVNDHFQKLREIFLGNGLVKRPELVYNIDEKGLAENMKVVAFTNAIGTAIPPMFLLKGQRLNPERYKDMSAGTVICMCSKGSMTTALFIHWLQHFARSVTAPSIVSGFRAMGIYPFDPHKIPDKAFAPSAVPEMPQENIAIAENVNNSNHSDDLLRERKRCINQLTSVSESTESDTDDSSGEQSNMSFTELVSILQLKTATANRKKSINYRSQSESRLARRVRSTFPWKRPWASALRWRWCRLGAAREQSLKTNRPPWRRENTLFYKVPVLIYRSIAKCALICVPSEEGLVHPLALLPFAGGQR